MAMAQGKTANLLDPAGYRSPVVAAIAGALQATRLLVAEIGRDAVGEFAGASLSTPMDEEDLTASVSPGHDEVDEWLAERGASAHERLRVRRLWDRVAAAEQAMTACLATLAHDHAAPAVMVTFPLNRAGTDIVVKLEHLSLDGLPFGRRDEHPARALARLDRYIALTAPLRPTMRAADARRRSAGIELPAALCRIGLPLPGHRNLPPWMTQRGPSVRAQAPREAWALFVAWIRACLDTPADHPVFDPAVVAATEITCEYRFAGPFAPFGGTR